MNGNWDASTTWGTGQFYKWLPVIDEELCTGCGLCVEACSPKCLSIVYRVAMLMCNTTCGSEGHCSAACPEDAIHMQWIPMWNMNLGKWTIIEAELGR